MAKTFYSKITYNPKWTAILIVGICLAGMLIGNYIERYRISNYRWIYEYGKQINFIMVFGSLAWSFFHPIIIWSNNRIEWKKYLIWILIGLIPILYFATMMTWIWIRFDNKIT